MVRVEWVGKVLENSRLKEIESFIQQDRPNDGKPLTAKWEEVQDAVIDLLMDRAANKTAIDVLLQEIVKMKNYIKKLEARYA